MPPDLGILSEIPLFGLLGEAERATLAGLLGSAEYRKGETIFSTGEPGDSLLIIRSGRVRVLLEDERGQRLILEEGGPGDIFGEISLFDGGPRTAGLLALTDVRALTLDRDDLLELVTRRPTAAVSLLTVMGRRLRASSRLLLSRGSRNVDDEEKSRMTIANRAADLAAAVVGSWAFPILATLGLAAFAFVPALPSLPTTLGTAMLAIVFLQVSILLIAWERQVRKARLKANLDHQLNLKTELSLAMLEEKMTRLGDQLQAVLAVSEAGEALGPTARGPAG